MRTGREYLRVSKDRSGRMRSTVEQHSENAGVADERSVRLGRPYQEARAVGASRYSQGSRDDFDALLADLRAGRFGADELWLWEPSRGSREVIEWVALIDACEQAQVQIWITTHRRLYDPANHRDRRTLLEDAVDSEFSAAEISERVKRSVRARAVAGRPHGRKLYGYRREHDPDTGVLLGVVPDEVTAPVVREVFARFAAGEGGTAIARDLSRRGIATPQGAAVWSNSTIYSMVSNEGHLGHRTSPRAGHARVENAWPAIVDEVTWWRCKARLDNPARLPRLDCTVKHLLSGIPDCGVPGCASEMIYKGVPAGRRGHHASYTCANWGHNNRKAGRWSPVLDECDGLEGQVVEAVLHAWEDDQRIGQTGEDPRIAELDADLTVMRSRLEDYRRAGARLDGPSPAAVAAVEHELEPKITAAERQMAALRGRGVLPDLAGRTLREAWPGLPLTTQRSIIAATVTVRVMPTGRGKRYDPALVQIAPRW